MNPPDISAAARSETVALPVLTVALDVNTGLMKARLPDKGAHWRGPFRTLTELVHAVMPDLPSPFSINFIDTRKLHDSVIAP